MLNVHLTAGDTSHDVIGGGQSSGRSRYRSAVRMENETRL